MTPLDRFEIADQIKHLPEYEKVILSGWLTNHIQLKYRVENAINSALESRNCSRRAKPRTPTLEDLGL